MALPLPLYPDPLPLPGIPHIGLAIGVPVPLGDARPLPLYGGVVASFNRFSLGRTSLGCV